MIEELYLSFTHLADDILDGQHLAHICIHTHSHIILNMFIHLENVFMQ